MKHSYLKLSVITVLASLFSFGLTAKASTHLLFENEMTIANNNEVNYDDLPPFVKEFLYKAYEVKPEDVQKITQIKDGSFLVKMNRSVNVFVIDTQLKTHHEKLSFLDIERDARAESRMEALKAKQQRRTIPIRTQVGKKGLAWNSIPLNVREYLIKRMEADENQVYKVHALGNNKYKVILKQAHDQFVIQTKSPNQIAFEHPDMN